MNRKNPSIKIQKVKTEYKEKEYVDVATGEVVGKEVEEKHIKILSLSQETYYATFYSVIGLIDDLTKTELKLIMYAALNCEMEQNLVNFTKPYCKDIEGDIGFTYQTIKNTVRSLTQKGILISRGSGSYRINPMYYWKGGKTSRNKMLKFVFEVECPECLMQQMSDKPTLEENVEFLAQTI